MTVSSKISPVPTTCRALISSSEACRSTGYSMVIFKEYRNNGGLVKGLHWHEVSGVIWYDKELIEHWTKFYFASPRRHQNLVDKIIRERQEMEKKLVRFKRVKANKSG